MALPAQSTEREVQVARDAIDAFGRAFTDGEIDAFVDLLSEDVDYEAPSVMQHTVMKLKGRDEVRRYVAETAGDYEELAVEMKHVRDFGGGRFVMTGTWHAQPRHTGTPFGTPIGAVLDVGDGRVTRLRAFFDEQLALDAARRD
ncbi:MAG TPA: nuclear transport factor 2 family protein [Thermoleophilaceae bacterium]|jgi:ketosteroid isomerase-like protein